MGKKMDALLGRGFKTSKFKATVGLAVSRLAVLKKQRQARCSVARSDVIEFLKTGNNERALLRVEQVMKEHNMLDVFVVLEGYCYLLMERVHSFQHEKLVFFFIYIYIYTYITSFVWILCWIKKLFLVEFALKS